MPSTKGRSRSPNPRPQRWWKGTRSLIRIWRSGTCNLGSSGGWFGIWIRIGFGLGLGFGSFSWVYPNRHVHGWWGGSTSVGWVVPELRGWGSSSISCSCQSVVSAASVSWRIWLFQCLMDTFRLFFTVIISNIMISKWPVSVPYLLCFSYQISSC